MIIIIYLKNVKFMENMCLILKFVLAFLDESQPKLYRTT